MSTAVPQTQPQSRRGRHRASKSATSAIQSLDAQLQAGPATQQQQNGRARHSRNNNQNGAHRKTSAPQQQPHSSDEFQHPNTTHVKLDSVRSESDSSSVIFKGRNPRQQHSRQVQLDAPPPPAISSSPSRQNIENSYDSSGPTATPAKAAAYAGPTFHASPAAAALPIPKFLKSQKSPPVEGSPLAKSAPAVERPMTSSSSGSDSSPVPQRPKPPESPLDIFFKADRAEKAKRMNNDTVQDQSQPPLKHPAPPLKSPPEVSHRQLFMMELDGSGSDAPSDLHGKTPSYRDRMSAVRTPSSPVGIPQLGHGPRSPTSLNFESIHARSASSTPFANPERSTNVSYGSPYAAIYGNLHRSHSGPSTPVPQSNESSKQWVYGNKDLSPLFRGDKPQPVPRSTSGLRQEFGPPPPNSSSAAFSGSAPAPTPLYGGFNPAIHANTATAPSQNHLNPNVHAPGMPGLQPPFTSPHQQLHPRHDSMPSHNSFPTAQNASYSSPPPSTQGYGPRTADIKSIEDDLRRRLNLSVMNSGVV